VRIIVTGGIGFIGTHLCKAIIQAGHNVVAVDNLSREDSGGLTHRDKDVDFRYCDIRSVTGHESILAGSDMVIHLAAKVGGINYYRDNAYEVASDNILIDKQIIDSVIKCRVKRFIYASSAHAVIPSLSYGLGKLVGEKLTQWAAKQYGIQVAIPRLVGIYGPLQDSKKETGSVIPVFTRQAMDSKSINCLTNGNEMRSYYYIDDCVNHLLGVVSQMMLCGFSDPNPYYLGSNEVHSIREIADYINYHLDSSVDISYSEENSMLMDSCPEVDLKVVSDTSLSDGISKVIDSMRKIECVS